MNKIKNKGITLIALVITIIVLLILAGVTIVTLTGENGLLGKASTAKEQTTIAEYKERIDLVKAQTRVANNGNLTLEQLKTALDDNSQKDWVGSTETVTENETSQIKLTTKDGYVFYITEDSTVKGTSEGAPTTASQITYTPDPTLGWTGVSTVEQALDYLYGD